MSKKKMLDLKITKEFKKSLKKIKKRELDLSLLNEVIFILRENKKLPEKYKDHALIGEYKGFRDCHIESDWVLIYKIQDNTLILNTTGTHSDLF